MMRLVTCVCILTIAALWIYGGSGPSCVLVRQAKPVRESHPSPSRDTKQRSDNLQSSCSADVLTIFLTGNELGTLKPCGCFGGQLGGLEKRSAVLNTVPASKRLIVDTGSLVANDREQDLIKFHIIIQAFSQLGYDLINLSEQDIRIAENLGLLSSISSLFNAISAYGSADNNVLAKFTKQLPLEEKTVTVNIAAFDAKSEPIEETKKVFACLPGSKTANILIVNHCDTGVISSIAKMGSVDCLICPAESDEPGALGDPNERPLVISVGRYGKYVGRLEIRALSAADWDKRKLKLSFSVVPVTEDLPEEKSLVGLYKTYQQIVKDENLLEKQIRFALPNGLEYTGSKTCESCHQYEYEKWQAPVLREPRGKAHAHAYATLEEVGSQYDPECVVCHVVGMEYESGFVSEEKTPHLKDVGCESCHGPGSVHIKTGGKTRTTGPWLDCIDCHTPEHSAAFAGNEQLYLEKIVHWREP